MLQVGLCEALASLWGARAGAFAPVQAAAFSIGARISYMPLPHPQPGFETLFETASGEFFNVLNHTNFSAIPTNYGAGNFGQVTSALDPRVVEMVLRFQF